MDQSTFCWMAHPCRAGVSLPSGLEMAAGLLSTAYLSQRASSETEQTKESERAGANQQILPSVFGL